MTRRGMVRVGCACLLFALGVGCSDNDTEQNAGTGATSGSGATGGAGGSAGAGGVGGTSATGGTGGSAGTGGVGGVGGAGGSGGAPSSACALPAPIDDGVTWQRTVYVATSGNDGSGDGSQASPFASISRALRDANAGTRVLVQEGTYGPVAISNLQGAANNPIGIYADGSVVLEARGASAIIAMSDPTHVVIDGFTLTGATVHGMNLDDGGSYATPAHHVVLRNLRIAAAGSGNNNDCIKLSGVDDFWVLDSDIAGCDRGEIIDMVGCHRGVISGNYFHDTVQNGVQAKGGSADTLIHGNRFERIPGRAVNAGGSTGVDFFRPLDASHEAARITIVGNVFVDNGTMSGAAVAYVGCDGCVAAHNTIIHPRSWVVRILQESTDARFVPSRNGLFVNNIIVLNPSELRAELVNIGGATAPETFTFGNNLWFAPNEANNWSPRLGSSIAAESGSLTQVDPRMVDRAGGDYRLLSDSPALGAAREVQLAVSSDFDGNCYAMPAAIGAFEH